VLPPEFLAPDVRRLFAAARGYLQGVVTIHELNGAITHALNAAQLGGSSGPIVEYLQSWRSAVNGRWNELGTEEHALSEDAFKRWLREQLLSDSEPSAR
jgi:hypothetical protein